MRGYCGGGFFFFQAEDGIRDVAVTGVQTCALPISGRDSDGAARPGDIRLHALAERLEVVRAGKRGGSDGSAVVRVTGDRAGGLVDRKSTRLNSSHGYISYAVFCLKKKNPQRATSRRVTPTRSTQT